ncbi:hypothetical protein W97_09174 [Coniosporium apollinis CBS 100218]|uniref:Uncharacterized protein n=1 Tax=Coniosporium apollinis (strain CBS 100218) TaxID=1168221 RepID=R7Z6U1_CONA1|nr:uncharacterized protein W97_09174 [Coniosporium apollinis CBS 100218]EON69910.1 hypothetical protein W97_09174 [Coniosporium apollinis CBS 100218]
MSKEESVLDWDLTFTADEDAEEELADEPEPINKALITDETIKQCRIIASVRCVEYGMIGTAPGKMSPALLLVFAFAFHPFSSRIKQADVDLQFDNGIIAILQPETVDDSESELSVRNKLYGSFSIGHDPVHLDLGAERETERTIKFALRIRGSGRDTDVATWTLKENPQLKEGIHLGFTAVVILESEGEVNVNLEVRAKIGVTAKNVLGIRKIITRKQKSFDGKTALGIRPETLKIDEGIFKTGSQA